MSLPVCALTTVPSSKYAAELTGGKILHFTGVASSASKILTVFHIREELKCPVLWIVDDNAMLERLASDVILWEIPDFFVLNPETLLGAHHIDLMRLVAMIHEGAHPFVITTPQVLAELKLPTRYDIEQAKITLKKGDKINFVQFFNKLIFFF